MPWPSHAGVVHQDGHRTQFCFGAGASTAAESATSAPTAIARPPAVAISATSPRPARQWTDCCTPAAPPLGPGGRAVAGRGPRGAAGHHRHLAAPFHYVAFSYVITHP